MTANITMEAMDDLSPIVKESLHNKIIQNGRLYILHNGYIYDILGNKIAE